MEKNKKQQIAIKLSEKDIAVLDSLGGKTKGIKHLINVYGTAAKKEKGSIEEQFYDMIIMPIEPHIRETYKTFVEIFIREGVHHGTIDYYGPKLSGYTGNDISTIRKHLRKLDATCFLRTSEASLSFYPTLRIREGIEREDFISIYDNFVEFVQSKGHYKDIGKELWGDEKRKEAIERKNSAKPIERVKNKEK